MILKIIEIIENITSKQEVLHGRCFGLCLSLMTCENGAGVDPYNRRLRCAELGWVPTMGGLHLETWRKVKFQHRREGSSPWVTLGKQ